MKISNSYGNRILFKDSQKKEKNWKRDIRMDIIRNKEIISFNMKIHKSNLSFKGLIGKDILSENEFLMIWKLIMERNFMIKNFMINYHINMNYRYDYDGDIEIYDYQDGDILEGFYIKNGKEWNKI